MFISLENNTSINVFSGPENLEFPRLIIYAKNDEVGLYYFTIPQNLVILKYITKICTICRYTIR